MTNQELQALLDSAEAALKSYRHEEAERLAQEALSAVDHTTDTSAVYHITALQTLGEVSLQVENFPLALERFAVALKLSEQHADRACMAKSLSSMGTVHWYLSDYTHAMECHNKALVIDEELGNQEGIAADLSSIGGVHKRLANFTTALENFTKALTIYQELCNVEGIARAHANIGLVYTSLSDYTIALEFYQKSLISFEELGNKEGIARNHGNIGSLYLEFSDYPKAIEHLQKALAINEEYNRKSESAINLSNIGGVHFYLADYGRALDYFQKALAIDEKLGRKDKIAMSLGRIGLAYQNLADYSNSLEYFHRSLAINEESGMKDGSATALANIGIVYGLLCDYDKSVEYLKRALEAEELLGNKYGIALNLGNLGETYSKVDFLDYDVGKAEEAFLKAVAISKEIGAKHHCCYLFKNLANLAANEQEWERAYEYSREYHAIYVEVQFEEATKQAQLLEVRRQVEESERDRQLKIARHEITVSLLNKTLPPSIATRLMNGERNIADKFESITILFADIVGFTPLSVRLEPKKLVELLNNLFSRFDRLTREFEVERIKTIGDAYMIVAGAPERCDDHALRMLKVAFAMLEQTELFVREVGEKIRIRIGINSGEAIGAVVGDTKFSYDLWSDAVNTASRMESHGEPGKIHVSGEFVGKLLMLNGDPFKGESETAVTFDQVGLSIVPRGEIEVKGKGMMRTYFLEQHT